MDEFERGYWVRDRRGAASSDITVLHVLLLDCRGEARGEERKCEWVSSFQFRAAREHEVNCSIRVFEIEFGIVMARSGLFQFKFF